MKGEAWQGAEDMCAYSDMKEANWKDSDKYFHARGNHDAAQRGPGEVWAAEVISDAREGIQSLMGRGHEDTMTDQEANHWGRSGKDCLTNTEHPPFCLRRLCCGLWGQDMGFFTLVST
ncbi:serum amyloid A-5 protein-like, partial [Onychomys torridus]